MTRLSRWAYHLRATGIDAVWIPLGVAVVFVWLVALGGEGIRRPATLTIWNEIVIPGLAALLLPFAASPARDPNLALMRTRPVTAWRIYLERMGLLLAVDVICGLAAGLVVVALALPGEPYSLAFETTLTGLPALLFFTSLAQLTALGLRSAPGGAAAAMGVWLFFLINRRLLRNAVLAYIYPFMTSFAYSHPAWAWNRAALCACGLAMLAVFAWGLGRGE